MTDHSILRPSAPDLPFQEEARLLTSFLRAIFIDLPKAFRQGVTAQHIYDELYVLDSPGLAALGIERGNIGRAALERAGMVPKK